MTVSAGTPFEFEANDAEFIAIDALSATQSITIFFDDTAAPDEVVSRVIESDETVGAAFTVSADSSRGADISALSSTKAIAFWVDSSGPGAGQVEVLAVSGTTVSSPGTGDSIGSNVGDPSIQAMSSSSAIAAMDDTSVGKAHYLTIASDNVTDESNVTFEAGQPGSIDITILTSTKALIAYTDVDDGNKVKVVVVSVSGTTISAGTEVLVDGTDAGDDIALAPISSSQALLVYNNTTDTDLKAVVISISGTVPTVNTPAVVEGSDTINGVALAAFSATEFVVTYENQTSTNSEMAQIDVSGTTVTPQSPVQLSATQGLEHGVAAFSSTLAIDVYSGTGDAVLITLSPAANHIWLSTDGAATFSDIGDSSWGVNVVGGVVVVPGTAYQTIFAAVGTNLYKTVNGGTNWTLETAIGYEVDFIDLEKDNTTVFLAKRDAAGTNRASLWTGAVLSHINTGKSTTGGATSGGDVV